MPLMRRAAALGAAVAAARRYARQNPEKVNRYADQAASFVDGRTGGRYRKQIDSALRQVRKETSVPGKAFPGQNGPGRYGAGQDGAGQDGAGQDVPRPTQQYPSYREDRPGSQR